MKQESLVLRITVRQAQENGEELKKSLWRAGWMPHITCRDALPNYREAHTSMATDSKASMTMIKHRQQRWKGSHLHPRRVLHASAAVSRRRPIHGHS